LFAEAARRRFRAQVTDRFLCMGGECNYLFRVTPVSATQCPHSTRILFTSAAGPAPARNAERGRLDTIRAAAATAAAGSWNTVPRLTCGGGTVQISLKRMAAAAAAAAAGQNEYGMVEVDEKLWVTEEMRGWADGPNPPPPASLLRPSPSFKTLSFILPLIPDSVRPHHHAGNCPWCPALLHPLLLVPCSSLARPPCRVRRTCRPLPAPEPCACA
jgi:hypothetical protein